MSNPKQIPVGTRFGRLTTISEVCLKADTSRPWSHGVVMCQCDCGAEPIEVRASSLRSGEHKHEIMLLPAERRQRQDD